MGCINTNPGIYAANCSNGATTAMSYNARQLIKHLTEFTAIFTKQHEQKCKVPKMFTSTKQ